jgi:hypothetical protein
VAPTVTILISKGLKFLDLSGVRFDWNTRVFETEGQCGSVQNHLHRTLLDAAKPLSRHGYLPP